MPLFSNLLAKLPKLKEKRMVVQGFALWICWHDTLDPVVNQTLQNYGGMFLKEDRDQSVWFFFNTDVFLALARLSVWAKFNSLEASAQLLSARFHLGLKREVHLEVEGRLENQQMYPDDTLQIWIHERAQEHGTGLPGITFVEAQAKQGVAQAVWYGIEADTRLPYTSSQGWYAFLRPLGNPLDKGYQEQWPQMQQAVADILEKHKLKFLVHEEFIIILIENLLVLRTWLREILSLCESIKTNNRETFWPHVNVVIDRKGFNFNSDLPNKVGLQWDKLSPDFPYMSYRTAYLLGDGFSIQDLRFSDNQNNIDSWCTVSLDNAASSFESIQVLMASQLLGNEGICCFHCGINTHKPHECPTKALKEYAPLLTPESTGLSLNDINESFRNIEKVLSAKGINGYEKLLGTEDNAKELLETIFEINMPSQVRALPHIWLTKGRDLGKKFEVETLERDDSLVWDFFDKFCNAAREDLLPLGKNVNDAVVRNPRDMRLRTLYGFIALGLENYDLALQSFKDAATLTNIPALQAYNEYLQARTSEIQGQYMTAISQYEQVLRVIPQWRDIEYRKIVCKVKMGFGEQILQSLTKLVEDSPIHFYRAMIDPEMGRGQALVLMHLYPLWKEAESTANSEKANVMVLDQRISNWFSDTDPNFHILNQGLNELKHLAEIDNYMAYLLLASQRSQYEKRMEEYIQRQIDELLERYKLYLASVQSVRDEAAWFPFPKVLKDFSANFNEVANILNWAFTSNFQEAEVFKQAQKNTVEVEKLIVKLKQKLKILRIIRDSTLFGVTLLKTFCWIELVGLLLCFLGIPAIVMFGDYVALGWLKNILASQQWEVQKVLLGIVTVIAFALAILRSTILFEKKRDKLLQEARDQREKMQNQRLEQVRRKNKAEAERLAKERKKEEERQMRLRLSGNK